MCSPIFPLLDDCVLGADINALLGLSPYKYHLYKSEMQVPNNYETDLIYPIMECAAKLAGLSYADGSEKVKTYLKVMQLFIDL